MKPMRTAVVSLTEKGRLLSERIACCGISDCRRFCFAKHTDSGAESFSDMSLLTGELFGRFDAIIFVCACGIAVRMIASHIRSKISDPAVLAVDDCGRFVIPLVSGHLGGANQLAEKIAELIGAEAVITTATDSGKCFSPDRFAAANGLLISDMQAAKLIASAVLDGEKIGFVCDYEHTELLPELTDSDERCGIYVGNRGLKPFEVTLELKPRELAVGIGCKRGTSAEKIAAAVASANISEESIYAVASIDLKADEVGLREYCSRLRIPFLTFSAEQLRAVGGDFSASGFVQQVTGVDNVCERSAVMAGGGELVIQKTCLDGVTVAAAKRRIFIDLNV